MTQAKRPPADPGRFSGTLRLALLKIGAQVRLSVRRITLAMASGHPFQNQFALAHARITAAA